MRGLDPLGHGGSRIDGNRETSVMQSAGEVPDVQDEDPGQTRGADGGDRGAPAEVPWAARTCTSPGAAELRMFAWLSAPVPSSSSTNTLFSRGGLGITDGESAGPDQPPP